MRYRPLVRRALITVLAVVLRGTSADAADYYVAKTGDNSRSCGTAQTIGTPKLTITNAVGCLSPGDTLFVRAGTYDEYITYVNSGTSWSNKVRIASYPGDARPWLKPTTANPGGNVVWLDCNCSYIEFDGINLSGELSGQAALWTSTNNGLNPHHIRIQNAEVITGAQGAGSAIKFGAHGSDTPIGATGSNEARNLVIHGGGLPGLCGYQCASLGVYLIGPNNLVEDCDIYDTSGAGIQIYSRADPANNNIVRRTKIHDITRLGDPGEAWGIIIAGGTNNQIYNNLIYHITVGNNSGDVGIAIAGPGTKVWNNTIYDVAHGGILIGGGTTGVEIRNNISYGNGGSQYTDSGSGTVQSNNLFGVDPRFVNAAGGDFHLQSISPAIDAGFTLSGVTTDLAGVTRPKSIAFDIGAYEFGSASSGPAAPTNLHIIVQ